MEAWDDRSKNAQTEWGEGGASEAFALAVSEMVNHKQVYEMLETQSQVYKSLKVSQESLTSFNDFSATLYRNTHKDFERRTKMIKEMQKDLDYIYRKLRFLKGKVEEVTGVPPEVVRATLREMDRAKAAFLGEAEEEERQKEQEEKEKKKETSDQQQLQQDEGSEKAEERKEAGQERQPREGQGQGDEEGNGEVQVEAPAQQKQEQVEERAKDELDKKEEEEDKEEEEHKDEKGEQAPTSSEQAAEGGEVEL